MPERKGNPLTRVVRALWNTINWTRRIVVNVLFVVLVGFVLALWLAGSAPEIEEGVALMVAPSGMLVDQYSGTPGDLALRELTGQGEAETVVLDYVRAIRAAADDDRIAALVLRLDGMAGGGLTKLQELRAAIEVFRASGKPVVAAGDFYFQDQYLVASAADEIWLHSLGEVALTGYGSYRNYYKDAIDKIELDWNVFRVGEYKSAVEPYTRNSMSEEAREARLSWMNVLWDAYLADAANARGLQPADLRTYIESYPEQMAIHAGNAAEMALAAGLVDHVASRDAMRDRLIELVGEDEAGISYRRVDVETYLEALGPRDASDGQGTVAVVMAVGVIEDGSRGPGTIGGDSLSRQLRLLRQDDTVEAVVLRIDSPGGSAFASEVIRREVELLRAAGKPVVVSMGSVAASGGYWISMSADEIWAEPTTITGSIGIFAMFPTYQRTQEKLGIHTDGVGTTSVAGALRLDRTLTPEVAQVLQLAIERGYREFITKAAEWRGMTVEEVDAIARGRVWSGADALRLRLVDQLGGLDSAIASAAQLAGLEAGHGVRYLEEASDFKDQMLAAFLARAGGWFAEGRSRGTVFEELLGRPVRNPWLARLAKDAQVLERFNDPRGLYAYCDCGIE